MLDIFKYWKRSDWSAGRGNCQNFWLWNKKKWEMNEYVARNRRGQSIRRRLECPLPGQSVTRGSPATNQSESRCLDGPDDDHLSRWEPTPDNRRVCSLIWWLISGCFDQGPSISPSTGPWAEIVKWNILFQMERRNRSGTVNFDLKTKDERHVFSSSHGTWALGSRVIGYVTSQSADR